MPSILIVVGATVAIVIGESVRLITPFFVEVIGVLCVWELVELVLLPVMSPRCSDLL